MAEALRRLDFVDPATFRVIQSLPVDCPGANHLDITPDGASALLACEFGARVVKIDLAARQVSGTLALPGSQPQDVRLAPDGRRFYVADLSRGGVVVVDAGTMTAVGFTPTGAGAHGIYPSRDGRLMYVTNRGQLYGRQRPRGPGSVSVLDPATDTVLATWTIPGGGSPDMGNLSVDGSQLWLSGRYPVRCTSSTRPPAPCSPASRWAPGRTA